MKKEIMFLLLVSVALQTFAQVKSESEFNKRVNEAEKRLKDKSTASSAHLDLGHLYYYGYSLPFTNQVIADYDKSLNHFKKAEKEHHQVVFNIGYFYYYGYAVKKDVKKAVKYFDKAAEANNPLAMIMLALIYDKGEGVPNNEQAETWVKKAIEIMHQSSTKADLEKPERFLSKWGICNELLIDAFIYSYPD